MMADVFSQKNSLGAGYRPLRIHDVVNFLDRIKSEFRDRPEIYDQLIAIMQQYRAQVFDTITLVDSVTILLERRPELVIDFNVFLPPRFEIKWQAVAGVEHLFLTGPDGLEVIVPAGPGVLQGFGDGSLAVMNDSHGEDVARLEYDPEEQKRRATARARVQKDVAEMVLPSHLTLTFIDADDPLHLILRIQPQEGLYVGGQFAFSVDVPLDYPFEAPRVRCLQRIFHPNVRPKTGAVRLSLLGEDWSPVNTLSAVVFGLQDLFFNPRADDALNEIAAKLLLESPGDISSSRPAERKPEGSTFADVVRASMAGAFMHGTWFERVSMDEEVAPAE